MKKIDSLVIWFKFSLKTTYQACLKESGLDFIFHWNAYLWPFAELSWLWVTENKNVSPEKIPIDLEYIP